MANYKLETSIQFPFFKLNELVSYTEVKKPEGIAFMILVLLSESKEKDQGITSALSAFGVPNRLHPLFANAISKLFNQDFLKMKTTGEMFDPNEFNSYAIKDIVFTEKGKKIFAEKSIPTGVTKEAKIPLYYNIALKKLSFAMDNSLEGRPLMDSPISPEFMDGFACEKDAESFLGVNRGTRIPIYENGKIAKYELIKKEEIITKVELQSKENWTGKYDCLINLEGDSCSFSFEDKAVQKFFEANYNATMVNGFLSFKSKFKFASAYAKGLRISSYQGKEIIDILVPKEIETCLKQKGLLLLTKGNYDSNSFQNKVASKEGAISFDPSCEFITVDQANNGIAYIPGVFAFESDRGWTISIPLVLRLKVSEQELKKALAPYMESLRSYSVESFQSLVKIVKISKDYECAFKIFENYLGMDPERNVTLLNEMKPIALADTNILAKYKEELRKNYDLYLGEANEDNLGTILKITSSIPNFLGIRNEDVLKKTFASLKEVKDKVGVYEAFAERGFEKRLLVLYVNPVPEALRKGKANEKSLVSLLNFDENLKKLKSLSGINDWKRYSCDEESIAKNDFKKAFLTGKDLFGQIACFKDANKALFEDYDGFMEVFGRINDGFNMADAALANPKAIKKEIIARKIDSGEYQYVLVNLSAKLEWILREKYGLQGTLSVMLSEARRSGALEKALASDLHDFREVRNSLIHANEDGPKYDANDLRRWYDEIFALEKENKDEPSGDN